MTTRRLITVLAVAIALTALAGCGSDDETVTASTTTDSTVSTTTTTTVADSTTTTTVADSTTTTTAAPSTTTEAPTSTTEVVTLEQPAIWPAADVVFDTPEAAAEDFMTSVLGVPAELSEFQQGDSRSGEFEVLPPAETGGAGVIRSVLLMRQLGPESSWFVIGAVNSSNTITSPESLATVAAGPIEVAGEGRGFEATLVIEAFVAGDASTRLDQQIGQGGATAETLPYSVTVDLSSAESGQTVMLLVRGGVGLESDPGEFSAIPVVIN